MRKRKTIIWRYVKWAYSTLQRVRQSLLLLLVPLAPSAQALVCWPAVMDCDHTLETYKQRLVDEAKHNNVPFNMDEHNGYAMTYKKYTADTVGCLKRRCDPY